MDGLHWIANIGSGRLPESVVEWIERRLQPESCNSEEFFYDEMESQSGYCLPVIHQEFDITKRSHWADRGALFDFLISTGGDGKRLLDFGPGDGWPSLIVAPFAREVVGVEGSRKRRDVCEANARRMGIANAEFVHTEPGRPLPFDDDVFDGIMAASSVEQTPDPRATLEELWRVLKPGGGLRIMYEDLDRYRGGREREVIVESVGEEVSRVVVYDRDIPRETARMYCLVISLSADEVLRVLEQLEPPIALAAIKERHMNALTPIALAAIKERHMNALTPHVTVARRCELMHPTGTTLVTWLEDTGFSTVLPTQSGIEAARSLYERLRDEEMPGNLAELDRLLRPLVGKAVEIAAPGSVNPPITAVK